MNVLLPKESICDFQDKDRADLHGCGRPTWWGTIIGKQVLCPGCGPCIFFKRYLSLTDDFAGQAYVLMPWVEEILREIFGRLDAAGRRIIQDVYLEVPKKNGKSILTAGIALFALVGQGRPAQRIYGAASAKEQAGEPFRQAAAMVRNSPELSGCLRVLDSVTGPKRIIRRQDPEAFYAVVSSDGDFNDGLNPSVVIRDEVHRWRARKAMELAEVLERGMIARAEPLLIDITTTGESEEDSPLAWRRHEYARQVKEGIFKAPNFLGRIYAADRRRLEAEPEWWKSREARVQANPSHEDNGELDRRGYLKDEKLAALCAKAQNDPAARSEYLRYHLGIWGQRDIETIDMGLWAKCSGGEDLARWPTYDVELLIHKWGLLEQQCWAGVDASWTTDLTSLVLVFPPGAGSFDGWSLLAWYWMPETKIAEFERKHRVPYRDWVDRGFITPCPGNAVDTRGIKERLKWAAEMFDLQELCYDPWNFRRDAMDLVDAGYKCVEVRQGYQSLSEATKKFLEIYQAGNLRHGNNPVLTWNARCLGLQGDRKDNVQPVKPERGKSAKRIDGISATVTALSRALQAEPREVGVIAL